MLGIMLIKRWRVSIRALSFYFFVQELLSIFVFISPNDNILILALIGKGGLSPFHGWLIPVITECQGKRFLWILTWQKLPRYVALVLTVSPPWDSLSLWFAILPLLQGILNFKGGFIYFLQLTSRGNSMLVLSCYSQKYVLCLLPLYMIIFYFLPCRFLFRGEIFFSWEVRITLFRFPGTIPFYVKLGFLSNYGEVSNVNLILFLVCNVLRILNSFICLNRALRYRGSLPPGYFICWLFSYVLILNI